MSPSHFEDYVSTHRILIQSPLIVERAVQRADLRSLKSFGGRTEGLADAVIGGLTVGRVAGATGTSANSVLKLAFKGSVPGECGTVARVSRRLQGAVCRVDCADAAHRVLCNDRDDSRDADGEIHSSPYRPAQGRVGNSKIGPTFCEG